VITLSGTGTAFDQSYYVDTVRHILAMRRGYTTEVVARNRSQGANVTQAAPTAPASERPDQAEVAE
jgi:hypothetical protein